MSNETNSSSNSTGTITEGMIIAYSGLYTMALVSIVYGAIMSARLVKKTRDEKKKMETSITYKDAKWFPVTASCVLFGLYCLFKRKECLGLVLKGFLTIKIYFPSKPAEIIENFLVVASTNQTAINGTAEEIEKNSTLLHSLLDCFTKENVSYFLLIFFCMQGVFAIAHMLRPLVRFLVDISPKFLRQKLLGAQLFHYRISFTRSPKEKVNHDDVKEDEDEDPERRTQFLESKFDGYDLISVGICSLIGLWHVMKRNWLSNNVFGLAFTIFGIEELHLSSFKAGAVLLAGLFVYDIFWVFATEVMSTVATSVNAPILLMFPQDLVLTAAGSAASTLPRKFGMLGLGDIVIPGIFLALLLRFGQKTGKKVYFYFTILAYGFGLLLTLLVMHYFKAAQPALLYLVPACLGAPVALAACLGDLKQLIEYDEVDMVKPEKKKKSEEQKKTN